jgi:hypothetical protein
VSARRCRHREAAVHQDQALHPARPGRGQFHSLRWLLIPCTASTGSVADLITSTASVPPGTRTPVTSLTGSIPTTLSDKNPRHYQDAARDLTPGTSVRIIEPGIRIEL